MAQVEGLDKFPDIADALQNVLDYYRHSEDGEDIDKDEDLEIISGVLNGLVAIDVKDTGSLMNYWNMYRGNEKRNGYFIFSNTSECSVSMGDVNGDEFVNVIDGDRLDSLAYKYYNDVTLWWVIAKANGLKGKPALSAGEVIRIPANITNIIEKFNNLNNGD